ncbi:unnamed protein product [Rotaria sp. Silwood1]|nr:unnamed protein product [Rotaria sp. Silwood1]CAF1132723.1 unnamed protein product [Rotaria sp. Silwood1]CAF3446469.1 unnamed protein product [Rotaria sp. Silwood1]CAF4748602.1 unnamed protein product [Rotaria sp. Silwood1]CAF4804517.1 unnamed protein product [Rotaria sp. Silwood1]
MMEAVNNWFDRAIQSSLDVPHPAEIDAQKPLLDATSAGSNTANTRNIVPFRILIKSLEILPSSVPSSLATPYEVQFTATLFDNLYKRFYGQTWFSAWHRGKLGTDGFFRVNLNEPLYCHIPLKNDQNCLIVQSIFRSGEASEDRTELVGGWTIIKLKPWTEDDDITKAISNRQPLYQGSPRALMYLNEPIETCQKATQVASAGLFVEIKYHEPLFSVIQYLSECTLYGRNVNIGGIHYSGDPNEDTLRKPVLQANRKNILIEQVEIDMEPSIDLFEEELCRLIHKDRMEKKKMSQTTVAAIVHETHSKVSIVERRLRVGIHNGQCYVQDPLVFYLTAEQEDTGMSSLSRKLSFRQTQRRRTVSAERTEDRKKLYLRNPIRLDDVPIDNLNAIVFVLEYMVSIPLGVSSKPNEPIENTKVTFAIRWVGWFPGKDKQVALTMFGGEILPSDELFVYKPSTTILLNAPDVVQEILRFNYRFDTEPPMRYQTVTVKPDILTPTIQKPSIPTDTSITTPINYDLYQRTSVPPQTIPSAIQPPIYHQANLVPWQADGIYPAYSPMSALASQMTFAHTLSRAAYSRLQGEGFPTIKTVNDKEAEIIDIRQTRFLDIQTETADPLNCNQINLHFLAYFKMIRAGMSSKSTYPKSLFFTFKFFRFPETTTSRVMLERLHDTISHDPNIEPYILWRLKDDSTKTSGLPGLPVKFQVDGAFLGSVEQRQFFEYLNTHTLYIEVWDGDGLFPVGMCALELRYLLRDGRPGVQALVELDVFATVPIESNEAPVMENQYYQSSDQQFSLIGEKLKTVGKLIMRIGNVGSIGSEQPSIEKLKSSDALRLLPPSRIISSTPPFDIVQQRPGEITTTGIKEYRLTRAHRIVDSYPNINSVLHSSDKQAQESERQRKLSRMEAVRKRAAETNNDDISASLPMTNRKIRELRENDLRTISMYRQQTKHEDIAHHLMNFITREVNIRLMPGYVEFFEYTLQNPYPEQHSISIACDDDELSVVTDAREWRRLKTLFVVSSDTEENMFTNQAGSIDQRGLKYPQIFMRAKELVHIPFKLQTFLAKLPTSEHKTSSNPFLQEQTYTVVEKNYNEKIKSKQIKALFQAEDGTPIGILCINVENISPIVDQTIRCINGENTLLKRVFRIPNPRRAITTESLTSGLPEQVHQVFVRASDLNIVCEVKPVPINQPCDMLIKAATHSAPTVTSFLVFMYADGFLHRPINVWQFQIHAVKRLDLTCVQYQTTAATLLLRGTRSSRLVQCFGNVPDELMISPSNAFSVAANGLHEVHLLVRPSHAGLRTYCVNAVDVENHQIVDTWMIRVDTRMPVISKQFAHTLPFGHSQPISKRISYTNPYAVRKTFFFISSHPELLQLQHQKVDFQANEKKFISFTLLPTFNATPVTDIIILINNKQDTNEDAYSIHVTYTDSSVPI